MARKRDPNFAGLPVEADLGLATLAADTVQISTLCEALSEDFHAISMDSVWSMRGHTAGEGPIAVGVAHGDFTAAEVEEYLELNYQDPHNKIDAERATRGRWIRTIAIFDGVASDEKVNNGVNIRTKLNFLIEDEGFNIWAWNKDSSSLTTGSVIECVATIYGRWVY